MLNHLVPWRRAARAAPVDRGWDFHCHLIPGVDDGVRTLEEARETIAALKALGFRGGVVTPHIYAGVYDNTAQSLREAFADFQQQIGDDYGLILGAEYHTTEAFFDLIAAGDLLHVLLPDRRLVLVEFPYLMPSPYGMEALDAVTRAGYQPVLAHVERYRYIQADPETWLADLARRDVWLQCNIGSLAGMYGERPRRMAQRLLDQGGPALWGSDVHRPMQIRRYVEVGLRELRGRGVLSGRLTPKVSRGRRSAFPSQR